MRVRLGGLKVLCCGIRTGTSYHTNPDPHDEPFPSWLRGGKKRGHELRTSHARAFLLHKWLANADCALCLVASKAPFPGRYSFGGCGSLLCLVLSWAWRTRTRTRISTNPYVPFSFLAFALCFVLSARAEDGKAGWAAGRPWAGRGRRPGFGFGLAVCVWVWVWGWAKERGCCARRKQ